MTETINLQNETVAKLESELLKYDRAAAHKTQDEQRWKEVGDLKEVELQETVQYLLWKLTQNKESQGDIPVIRSWCHSAIENIKEWLDLYPEEEKPPEAPKDVEDEEVEVKPKYDETTIKGRILTVVDAKLDEVEEYRTNLQLQLTEITAKMKVEMEAECKKKKKKIATIVPHQLEYSEIVKKIVYHTLEDKWYMKQL